MRRVVILSAFLSPFRSGAEACAEETALRLHGEFDVTIVTARLRSDLPAKDLLRGTVPVVRVGIGSFVDKWLYPFLAPFAARRLKPDLIHAVLETFAGLALSVCRFVVPSARRLLTLQTTNSTFLRGPILKSAQHVTAISSALVRDARARGVGDIELIPNGIDTAAIRNALAIHPKLPGRILFVGRLEPMKGIDTLLRSVALLDPALEWSLRIVGSGSQREALETLTQKLGLAKRVSFAGRLQNTLLFQEYAEAEIFAGLSRSEALGNVFLEAQAAGCAVVATNVGGIPDIVRDAQTGSLVPPDDDRAAARAIEQFLRQPNDRESVATAGRRHAVAYDWESIAERYAVIYRSLLP
jgi:glycosyltransferase involved in cell wall biosynthesis